MQLKASGDGKVRRSVFTILLLAGSASPALSGGANFDTPQSALDAFVGALKANDQSKMLEVFGPEAEDLVGTGDPAEDQERRQEVLSMYAEGYRFQPEDEGVVLLWVKTVGLFQFQFCVQMTVGALTRKQGSKSFQPAK